MKKFKKGDPIATRDGDRLGKVIWSDENCIDVQWSGGEICTYTYALADAYQFEDTYGIVSRAIWVWAKMKGYDVANGCGLAVKVIDFLEKHYAAKNRT